MKLGLPRMTIGGILGWAVGMIFAAIYIALAIGVMQRVAIFRPILTWAKL